MGLDDALAVGFCTHLHSHAVVGQRTRHKLACRCRVAVGKHNYVAFALAELHVEVIFVVRLGKAVVVASAEKRRGVVVAVVGGLAAVFECGSNEQTSVSKGSFHSRFD